MRISTDKSDRGYLAYRHAGRARVTLDGVELKHCITADEDTGEVVVIAHDENDQVVIDYAAGKYVRETKCGVVVVHLEPDQRKKIERLYGERRT